MTMEIGAAARSADPDALARRTLAYLRAVEAGLG